MPLRQKITDANGKVLKFDIVVHGRFHGFALANALLAMGHDVLVHTNYPAMVVERFGVPRENVRTFLRHGIATRCVGKLGRFVPKEISDRLLHRYFGKWAASSVRRDTDVVYGFTGVMEEYLQTPRDRESQIRAIVRGSAHIRAQADILTQEERRVARKLDRPSDWMIDREEREYALADCIFVLSEFAYRSFVGHGIERSRIYLNPLGVDVKRFKGGDSSVAHRLDRIRSNKPLRILNVGTFSFRKGARDLAEMASHLSSRMEFRFVGDQPAETADLVTSATEHIRFVARVPEAELTHHYEWADIFVFPTIEDGFAAVLLQAAAARLPILASRNSAAPDFIEEGVSGWVKPIRDPAGFVEQLLWCDRNRTRLSDMVANAQPPATRSWAEMAGELVAFAKLAVKTRSGLPHDR